MRFFGRGVGDKVLEGKVLTGEARSGWGTASMQGLGWQGVQGFFFQTRSAFKQTHKNEQRIVLKWGCEGVWGGDVCFFKFWEHKQQFAKVGNPRNHSHECHDVIFMGLRSIGLGGGDGTVSAMRFGIPACSVVGFCVCDLLLLLVVPRPSVTRSLVHDSSFVYHPTPWGIV